MEDYSAKVWRICIPPTPCMVVTARVFPGLAAGSRWRNQTPLWKRSHGLQLPPELPGVVLRWAMLAEGGWLAEVRVEARTGHGVVPLTIWVDQSAVRAV
ncbi:hypothetical protein [Tsukamurella tyrosinosolvens]|uniref:hypothetical protein n=1 Tax=Tsukamurella tyrosinosolvens TaxID=57704 RepID=UPI002DD43256|nr:hypothetical protein [Tsukamurella tyrosinosolvens]MEC4614569.1 hypothetical protein [Tsukamurella tyrosinosolvens]